MRVRDRPRTRFEIEAVEIASDFSFRVRRSVNIIRHAGGRFGFHFRSRGFVFFGNLC